MTIVPVDNANRPDALRVLAQAFRDDPLIRWLQGPTRTRDEAMFGFINRYHRAPDCSSLFLDDGRPIGAAVWDPPGYRPEVDRFRDGLRALNTFRGRLRRAMILDELFPKLRPTEPHWYLSTIGAIESGRGIGSKLLEDRLSRINGPAYLESSNAANLPLYERFGFTVTDELRLPFDGPTFWPMYRAG